MKALQPIKDAVRTGMRSVARVLNRLTGGRLHPDTVTIFGLLMHIPIAVLIGTQHPWRAAVLLVIFGLFDTLDGELARLQKRSSSSGMLLDASTDRMKEVMLYGGISYFFVVSGQPKLAVWAVIACGASLCVSYVKAKGEAAVASLGKAIDHHTLNHMFKDGLFTFEVRMAALVLGLAAGYLDVAVVVIALFSSVTAFQRLIVITRALRASS